MCGLVAFAATALTKGAEQTRAVFKADEVEAVFLVNFCRFTNWPPHTFSSPQEPITIAVWASTDFATLVERAAQGEHVGPRVVTVKRIQNAEEAKSAQIVFVAAAEENAFERTFENEGSHALVVGESPRILSAGGHLEFVPSGRMKLRVNIPALKSAGIELNSNLLRICESP